VQVLTEDYSKIAFLTANRALEFHTRMGRHVTTRVPKAGRALAYLPTSAELLVGGSAPELWRLSLYEGRFLTPLASAIDGVNAVGVCPAHGMVAAAGEGGLLECFDPRLKASLGAINAAAAMAFEGEALTALRFDSSGLYVAVGTSGVRDIGSLESAPLHVL
jgi:ribosome biogenesis protein ENP2